MTVKDIPTKGLSPLWIIALFLSFSETVLGVAVMKTQGTVQMVLTVFVVAFPTLISCVFFFILWNKNFVFYPPTEYGDMDVQKYVDAMSSPGRANTQTASQSAVKQLEIGLQTLSVATDPKSGVEAERILRDVIEKVKASVIRIDSRPMFGPGGRVWEEAYSPDMPVYKFLNALYFAMRPWGLKPFTYGKTWAIRLPQTGEVLSAGRLWADTEGDAEDERPIAAIGLVGGSSIEIVSV